MQTNRDLYLFVQDLIKRQKNCHLSLEEYLRSLWKLGSGKKDAASLNLGDFARLLAQAFEAEPPVFDPAWSELNCLAKKKGYAVWEQSILCQIVDLKEMRQAGVYQDELRYYGVPAPRGSHWYNFDPLTYLECAVQGTFGGWQAGDDSGRMPVPGPVAAAGEDGKIQAVDPATLDDPLIEIESISWETFTEFLWAGQAYE